MIGTVRAFAGGDHALALVDYHRLDGGSAAIHAEIVHSALVAENIFSGKREGVTPPIGPLRSSKRVASSSRRLCERSRERRARECNASRSGSAGPSRGLRR